MTRSGGGETVGDVSQHAPGQLGNLLGRLTRNGTVAQGNDGLPEAGDRAVARIERATDGLSLIPEVPRGHSVKVLQHGIPLLLYRLSYARGPLSGARRGSLGRLLREEGEQRRSRAGGGGFARTVGRWRRHSVVKTGER